MTNEQKIKVIAKACGWRDTEMRPHPLPDCGHVLSGRIGAKDYILAIPKFLTDANTRPEMLAVMSNEQKYQMLTTINGGIFCMRHIFDRHSAQAVLEINQPTFADCWLKAKGLWREET